MARGERSLCNDSGSELCLGGEKEKEKCENARWDEQKRQEKAVLLWRRYVQYRRKYPHYSGSKTTTPHTSASRRFYLF